MRRGDPIECAPLGSLDSRPWIDAGFARRRPDLECVGLAWLAVYLDPGQLTGDLQRRRGQEMGAAHGGVEHAKLE